MAKTYTLRDDVPVFQFEDNDGDGFNIYVHYDGVAFCTSHSKTAVALNITELIEVLTSIQENLDNG